jgi:circadian clock protein KaiC
MNEALQRPPALDRLHSGVSGLDVILSGGFFQSGVYIIQGPPGCGKTILANQICFAHVKAGGTAVYATLLAESHSRMLQHLGRLSFFDLSVMPEKLTYVSAFNELESEGLSGLMGVLRREMRARKAGVLVLDGLVAATESASTGTELKKFVHEIQSNAVFHGCTVFLLTSAGEAARVNAEHTMVDGLIQLEDRLYEARAERSIQVRKFRGDGVLRGKHAFAITDDGIRVFPRIEAVYRLPPEDTGVQARLTSGAPSLDRLFGGGGFPAATATMVIGSTGTGKTTLGLQFLAQSRAQEPGLLFSFFEAPSRIRGKAASLGLPWHELEAAGHLHQVWHPQGEHLMDELGHRLLDAVNEHGIRRLVIDGLSGFFESAVYPERVTRFFSCLVNELRRRGVTTMMTLETRDAVGSTVSTQYGVSGFIDNLVFLRFVSDRGRARRILLLIKVRDADFDPRLQEMAITSSGIRIAGAFDVEGDVIPTAAPAPPDGPELSPPTHA